MSVRENLDVVRERVRLAALRAGRDPKSIQIIGVTKRISVDIIRQAVEAGLHDLGENRVQELQAKVGALPPGLRWHMIGHLQTNKVKHVVGNVALIHSVDSWGLALEIDRRAAASGTIARVLVQVNTSGEDSKFGISPDEARDFMVAARDLRHVEVQGLMTMAPFVEDPNEARPCFRDLRLLAGRLNQELSYLNLRHLSMGMSNDYEVAVEEGADLLRLGTALFGARIYEKGVGESGKRPNGQNA